MRLFESQLRHLRLPRLVNFCSSPAIQSPAKLRLTYNGFQHRASSSSASYNASQIPGIENCPCSADIHTPGAEGLEIDHTSPISGVITRHYRHVLIHTGTNNWPSRIESDDKSVAAKLKSLISRRGLFVDPFYPILVTNASFPAKGDIKNDSSVTISIFPEGIEIPSIPNTIDGFKSLVTSFLLPPSETWLKTRTDPSSFTTRKITKPVILACSHGSRDERCGILGPAIAQAFERALEKQGGESKAEAIVGEISHIGGHKFAGNIIIHLPAEHKLSKAINSAAVAGSPGLDLLGRFVKTKPSQSEGGTAIWYGRVMPNHVEGIIENTLKGGRIIKELLRGLVNSNGDLIDLRSAGLQY
ncbi:hypothetical protein H072_5458 [Dactylellina haptotyla CBS 200.50]|uniref:Altered inheritance of mitochondria protein 32 n=1 Tax=Dactylellina haptotyla (strain CBS 200.50) TaxID=1284197 RepID=S8AHN6_DACHA|nr:hypothetical protein H072_5458 [Dactylellina haptotyla CBS 200.50]